MLPRISQNHEPLGPRPASRAMPSRAQRERIGHEPSDSVTRNAHREMVQQGLYWQHIARRIPLNPRSPIASLALRNIAILGGKIMQLTPEENLFYQRVMQQPWFLTHFTSASTYHNQLARNSGHVVLKSYTQRQRESPHLPVRTNAAPADLKELGGGDFVYLCVELGQQLKKTQTRSPGNGSGTVVIRTPLDQPATRHAMSLHGDIFDGLRVAPRLPLPSDVRAEFNRHLSRFEREPVNSENGFARTIFYTPRMIKEGTTLQAILDLRQLPPALRTPILQRQGSADLNEVISSLARTQVMVAKQFVTHDYRAFSIKPADRAPAPSE